MATRMLSVGNDPVLMSSRTLILGGTGYVVDEAYSVDNARSLVEPDLINLTLTSSRFSCATPKNRGGFSCTGRATFDA